MGNSQAKENRSKHLKEKESKKKLMIVAGVILALLVWLVATNSETTSITDYEKISEGGIIQVYYGSYVDGGLDYEFTLDELDELKGILSTSEMMEVIPFSDVTSVDFLVYFYDSDGNQLFGLYMMNNGDIYYNNTHIVKTTAVAEFLNKYRLLALGDSANTISSDDTSDIEIVDIAAGDSNAENIADHPEETATTEVESLTEEVVESAEEVVESTEETLENVEESVENTEVVESTEETVADSIEETNAE